MTTLLMSWYREYCMPYIIYYIYALYELYSFIKICKMYILQISFKFYIHKFVSNHDLGLYYLHVTLKDFYRGKYKILKIWQSISSKFQTCQAWSRILRSELCFQLWVFSVWKCDEALNHFWYYIVLVLCGKMQYTNYQV